MRTCLTYALLAIATSLAWSQQAAKPKSGSGQASGSTATQSVLKDQFEAKIKAEWEALKKKDKKAYGDLLADDYEGVEVDRQGERTKIQSVNEVDRLNIYDYTLFGFKLTPLGQDAAFVVYEVTMQFPPKAQVRYARVYISELWVKRDGQWKELHYQETNVK